MTGPFDLTGKCAVVTGDGSGIGLAMADVLARSGARLCRPGIARSHGSTRASGADRRRARCRRPACRRSGLPHVPASCRVRPDDFAVYLASEASRYQIASQAAVEGGYSMF